MPLIKTLFLKSRKDIIFLINTILRLMILLFIPLLLFLILYIIKNTEDPVKSLRTIAPLTLKGR